jgi:hypothetical protein
MMDGALPRIDRLSRAITVLEIKSLIAKKFKDALPEEMLTSEEFLNKNM